MSSGSYFTLYRKYDVKASDDVYNALCDKYISEQTKSSNLDNEKSNDELKNDLPAVLELNYSLEESKYDDATHEWKDIKDYSIEGQRKQYYHILKDGKNWLDELLVWHFGSGFTCIKNEFNLRQYSWLKSSCIINKQLAEKIHQACCYLLSEKWSADFEQILNNEWINILASGNDSDKYWKYIYRNFKKKLSDIDDEEFNSAEYDINKLKNVMNTFINIDEDYSLYGKIENILVYTVW